MKNRMKNKLFNKVSDQRLLHEIDMACMCSKIHKKDAILRRFKTRMSEAGYAIFEKSINVEFERWFKKNYAS